MTTRVTKELDAEHFVQLHSSCGDAVTSESECAVAAAKLAPPGFTTTTAAVRDASLPGGCSFAVDSRARRIKASFNAGPVATAAARATAPPACGAGMTALLGVEASLVTLQVRALSRATHPRLDRDLPSVVAWRAALKRCPGAQHLCPWGVRKKSYHAPPPAYTVTCPVF